jgi:cytochrome P450
MAFPFLLQLLIISTLVVSLLYVRLWRSRNGSLRPIDWPVVGVLPSLISRLHNLHDELTVVLAASGCNFKAQGPLGSGMRFFVTADPANVRHIFTSNHANYPKGEELAEIFDIVSGSILTVDGEACRQQRGMFQSVLSNPRVLELMSRCCRDKVVDGLLPFLARMERTGTPFDMQDLMTRLIFDLTATPIFGVDPGCLSTNMPSMHVAAAMDSVMEVGLLRHTVPASCWKMMRQLNLGPERKLAVAHTLLHGFIREMMEKTKGRCSDPDDLAAVDILSGDPAYSSDKALLSRILINYMIAGRDTVGTTLPWVFYNLAKNPRVVSGIREELAHIASLKASAAASNDLVFFESEETKDLVYLQAALFESLRQSGCTHQVRSSARW